MWSSRPTHKKSQQTRNPDMAAIKELDTLLHQLIQAEEKTDEYATIIGNVEHIHDEYEPSDHIEDLYITALVQAEILAETVVNILHPEDFATDDNFWHAIVNIRLYIQNTDVNELSIEGLEAEIAKVN
jgi:hypothetical protein